jgi:hypothetical protein
LATAIGLGLAAPAQAEPVKAKPSAPQSITVVERAVSGPVPGTATPTGVIVDAGPGWVLVGEGQKTTPKPGEVGTNSHQDCGYISCSLWFTRGETKNINKRINLYGGGIAGLGLACGYIASIAGPAGPMIGLLCGAAIITYGTFFLDAVTRAAADNKCLRIRSGPGQPYTFHSDGNRDHCWN